MAVTSVQMTIEGVVTDLTLNSDTGLWEADAAAPGETSYNNNTEHYFPITIKATDSAGNSYVANDTDAEWGDVLRLRVKETVPPAIVITSPTEGELTGNAMPVVNWTVTDSGAGINPDTIGITINDSAAMITGGITKTPITNGYQCSYSIGEALPDGANTIAIDATDYDDNPATQRVVNFVVDTVPPALSVASPVNDLITNVSQVTVAGAASDATAGLSKVTVRLNGGTETELTVGSGGNFTKDVALSVGANTIVVTAVDLVGASSSITRIVTLDIDAPVIEDITVTPNPASTGEIIRVSAKVTD